MNTFQGKTNNKNNSNSISNNLSEELSKGESTFQIIDNRPESIAQRKLQESADNCDQVKRLGLIQQMANNYVSQTVQKKENNEEKIAHGKPETIQEQENKTGLPDKLKSGMENLSGYSLDDVKVHYNSSKPSQLHAHAYAQGTDIHIASGQEKHLPHEAWHVVQQKQGRVKPTVQLKNQVNVNDDSGLEMEADIMGNRALNEKGNIQMRSTLVSSPNGSSGPIQRLGKIGHIALGAFVGTIVPVIGTIIGGIIGYKIWKSKQANNGAAHAGNIPAEPTLDERIPPLEEKSIGELQQMRRRVDSLDLGGSSAPQNNSRVAVPKTDGALHSNSTETGQLREWIEMVKNLILGKHFEEAYQNLIDAKIAARFGVDLFHKDRDRGNAVELAKKNRFDGAKKLLTIAFPVDILEIFQKDSATSTKVLLMALEEYMHMYQAKSNQFLSKKTESFKSTGKVEDSAVKLGFDSGDYDEIDVFAQLIDWGFDVKEIDYFSDYDEREEYWRWWQSNS